MNKNRKGDISIGLIFSIVITIIGIMLLLILAGKTSDGKKFYCELSNKYAPRFYSTRMDSFCYGVLEHTVEGIRGSEIVQNNFSDRHLEKSLIIKRPELSQDFYITIDRDTNLRNAQLNITLPRNNTLKTFFGGDYNITLPPYSFNGGIQKAFIYIPKSAVVTNASINLFGANYPMKTDIVFAIDTSGSMANEWSSVCDVVKTVGKNLTVLGVKEFRLRVYGIGGGATYKKCTAIQNFMITKEELQTIPINEFNDIRTYNAPWDGNCYNYPLTDDYTEAWALASAFLSKNLSEDDGWMEDAKRIEVLISDSDPTGGYYLKWCENSGFRGSAHMSGNEQEAISIAKNYAHDNNIFTNVIYGDDVPPPAEGFNIGCKTSGCCVGECEEIMDMMQDLASSTGGKIISYRNTQVLQEAMLKIVISNYPSNLSLSVDGIHVMTRAGELNTINSPWRISSSDFVNALQQAIDSCTPDDYGKCLIPIEVSSSTDGTVILNGLSISYKLKAEGVSLAIEEINLISNQNLFDNLTTVNFSSALSALKNSCSQDFCTFKLTIHSEQPSELIANALAISYQKFFIKEELASAIAECWTKARFGQEKSDFFCQEFPIPSEYGFIRPITEADIANVLKARQWCHIIADSDFGCGDSDSIKFTKDIKTRTNVLIEYKAKEKAVFVS
ncbi:MAG: hypothetical protein NTZ02_03475 [Candidatus Woesearchaeota archaeon]|nr:hypothetical protein [Candidatus Woesearchaeota archaeon]